MARSKRHLPTRKRYNTRRAQKLPGSEFFDPEKTPLRHELQEKYDNTTRAMAEGWLTDPPIAGQALRVAPHLGPRGIRNFSVHCYQNSVYQTLMHIPILLQWICTHVWTSNCTATAHCVKCNMKSFIQSYWGSTSPENPIELTAPHLRNIKQAAWDSHLFNKNQQEDVNEFYQWIVRQFNDESDPNWEAEWMSLFTMNYQPYLTCQTCGDDAPVGTGETNITLEIPILVAKTVNEAITLFFTRDQVNCRCSSAQCQDQSRDKIMRLEIRAAPRVLVVTLKIFVYANTGRKIFTSPQIEEHLDLTQFQQQDAVSLRYTLSSVISHNGPDLDTGHYIASVRSHSGCKDRYWNISDERREILSHRKQFTSNPQRPIRTPRRDGFQVYTLTYIRDGCSIQNIEKSRMVASLRTTL